MPEPALLFGAVMIGAIIGSFINALVYRFRSGETMEGRSHCVSCNHTLYARDLVPIFSFLLLRGRCRYCKEFISIQYPLVELVAMFLSVGVFLLNPFPLPLLLAFFFWMTTLFSSVYDLRFQELPNNSLILGGLLGLATVFINCGGETCVPIIPALDMILAGPFVALPLLSISALSKERAMGWGDGFFMIGFGWLLGMSGGFSALFIGVWSGAIFGLLAIAWQYVYEKILKPSPQPSPSKGEGATVHHRSSEDGHAKVTMKSKIPFAPFLALGAIAVYFFHANFLAMLLAS